MESRDWSSDVCSSDLGVIGVQQRNKVGCLWLGKLGFHIRYPAHKRSDFLLDVPDHGVGGFDPAVELAFLGAYTFFLHCPDGCALLDGGKSVSYTHLLFLSPKSKKEVNHNDKTENP